MRHRSLIAVLALLLAGLFAPAVLAGGAPPGFVTVSGRQLIGPDGAPFHMRGIGLGNWLVPEGYMFRFTGAKSPREIAALVEVALGPEDARLFWERFRSTYVTEDDIRLIARAGFNTVRVPLHWGMFLAENDPFGRDADRGPTFSGPGFGYVDQLIGWARAAGLKVLLDLHAAPGGQTGVNHDDGFGVPTLFYVGRERRRTAALWREIARRYADEPAVLGYELLNEPISTYADEDLLNPMLAVVYRELVAAIREVDKHHLVVLAGSQWSQNFEHLVPPFDAGTVYAYHKFWAPIERGQVQVYENLSRRYRVPVILSEAGESKNDWIEGFRKLNERAGIGWSFWTYKNLASTKTVVTVTPPAGWDRMMALGAMRDPSLDAVGLTRAEARRILFDYIEATRLTNARINGCYLEALGLGVPEAPCTAADRASEPD